MADVTIARAPAAQFATVVARKSVAPKVVGAALGIALEDGPRVSNGRQVLLVGVGPRTWLVKAADPAPFWTDTLAHWLDGKASVFDQSGAYAGFGIQGAGAGEILQRAVAIDLDPAAFGPGSAAVTVIAHMPLILWREHGEPPAFQILVPRTFAASFEHWLGRAQGAPFC